MLDHQPVESIPHPDLFLQDKGTAEWKRKIQLSSWILTNQAVHIFSILYFCTLPVDGDHMFFPIRRRVPFWGLREAYMNE